MFDLNLSFFTNDDPACQGFSLTVSSKSITFTNGDPKCWALQLMFRRYANRPHPRKYNWLLPWDLFTIYTLAQKKGWELFYSIYPHRFIEIIQYTKTDTHISVWQISILLRISLLYLWQWCQLQGLISCCRLPTVRWWSPNAEESVYSGKASTSLKKHSIDEHTSIQTSEEQAIHLCLPTAYLY